MPFLKRRVHDIVFLLFVLPKAGIYSHFGLCFVRFGLSIFETVKPLFEENKLPVC